MTCSFPSQSALHTSFASSTFLSRPKARAAASGSPPAQAIWTTWSAIDNVKDKAEQVKDKAEKATQGAAKEYQKASSAAQQKVGGIELYSSKYYAACTFGGILACVSDVQPLLLA